MDQNTSNQNPAAPVDPVQPVTPPAVTDAPAAPASEPSMANPVNPAPAPSTVPADVTPDAIREQLQATLQDEAATVTQPATATEPEPAPAAVSPEPPSPQPVEAAVADQPVAPVTIYTIETCPYCKAEKEYLTGKSLAFTEKRVDTDEASLKEMLSLSDNFAGVPVSVLQGEKEKRVVKGFTQSEFEEELRSVGLLHDEAPAPVGAQPAPETPSATPPAVPAEPAPATAQAPAPAPVAAQPAVPDFQPTPPVSADSFTGQQ